MNYIHLEKVDSTNSYLKARYKTLPNWTILTTDLQSKGRGRLNHVWKSHKGKNLLCSILIKDKKILKKHKYLVELVGKVIHQLLIKLDISNWIKPPNDIYVKDKKICGILLETISISDKLEALVIGIGLNLNQKTFSKTLNATSYYLIKKKEIDINKVKKIYIDILNKELNKLSLEK